MSAAIFLLVMLSAVGSFADFIVGKRGQRTVKDIVVKWYVELSDRPWSSLASDAADAVDRFLTHSLGAPIVSWKGLLRIFTFNALLDVALICGAYSFKVARSPTLLRSLFYYWFGAPLIVLSNTLVNAISLGVVRLTYRAIRRGTTSGPSVA